MTDLRECPFCGGEGLVMSVNGGVLPSFMDMDKQCEIMEKTHYVVTCEVSCDSCGAKIEGWAASISKYDDLSEKAIKNCYEKWNRRAKT